MWEYIFHRWHIYSPSTYTYQVDMFMYAVLFGSLGAETVVWDVLGKAARQAIQETASRISVAGVRPLI